MATLKIDADGNVEAEPKFSDGPIILGCPKCPAPFLSSIDYDEANTLHICGYCGTAFELILTPKGHKLHEVTLRVTRRKDKKK